MSEASTKTDGPITNTRTVIVGFTKDGERCILEWAMPPKDPAERLRYWQKGVASYAYPYGHDVHIALERVTTEYERVMPPAQPTADLSVEPEPDGGVV